LRYHLGQQVTNNEPVIREEHPIGCPIRYRQSSRAFGRCVRLKQKNLLLETYGHTEGIVECNEKMKPEIIYSI
jgi:hypothetical protein